MEKLINNEARPRKDEFERIICDCCGSNEISDDDDIADEMLCDICFEMINDNTPIGYGKGE